MKQVLREIFETYYKDVYLYLYSLNHDAQLSEDLASEVFVEVVRSIDTFRGESNMKTWLFSIARHRWFRYLRKKNREIHTELLEDFLESTGELTHGLEQNVIHRETLRRVQELIKKEPKRTQNIVEMRLKGYSFYEIGLKYGISENSARVIDFRTKTKIREILKKEGYMDE